MKIRTVLGNESTDDVFTVYVPEKLSKTIKTGDCVEIFSSTTKIVGYVKTIPGNFVYIHENLRAQNELVPNEIVFIQKVSPSNLESVTIRSKGIVVQDIVLKTIKEYLNCVPLIKGMKIPFEIFNTGSNQISLEIFALKAQERGKTIGFLSDKTDLNFVEHGNNNFSNVRYEDIGGLSDVIETVRENIEIPFKHPEIYKIMGISAPHGILLKGPPGCGKTLIAKAIASEIGAKFFSIRGPELLSKMYGESEKNVRNLFAKARNSKKAVIFFDEIDSIASQRENEDAQTQRVLTQLLAEMDGLGDNGNVIVVAATNRPDTLDEAIRRTGRFDREIEVPVPTYDGRREILSIHTKAVPLDNIDMENILDNTNGFSGSDLAALVREAVMTAIRKIIPDFVDKTSIDIDVLKTLVVTTEDFLTATNKIEPSGLKEIHIIKPKISFENIGGHADIKRKLIEIATWPIKHAKILTEVGIKKSAGLLLYGPPGCGKTILSEAIAKELGYNLVIVRGPEILSKWFGESEKNLRKVFDKAKQVAPCVLVFDEADALAVARTHGNDTGSMVHSTIANQFLTLLDEAAKNNGIFVILTTNRPDFLDSAILRKGRIGSHFFVEPPNHDERLHILKIHTRKMQFSSDVDLEKITEMMKGFSGADIEEVCKETMFNYIRREGKNSIITAEDLTEAIGEIIPSFDEATLIKFKEFKESLKAKGSKKLDVVMTTIPNMYG